MTVATQRTLVRWMHLVFSVPIIGYIYSPYEELPNFASVVRFVFVPLVVLSGLWLWKGHVIRRLWSRRSTQSSAASGTQTLG